MTLEKNKLPEKYSDLIKLAIKDLLIISNNPNYHLNMGSWHTPVIEEGTTKCHVCMAGAVMANTLKYDKNMDYGLIFYERGDEVIRKLLAIDSFRKKEFGESYKYFKDGYFYLPEIIEQLDNIKFEWNSYKIGLKDIEAMKDCISYIEQYVGI